MLKSFLALSKSRGANLLTFGSASAVCTAKRAVSSAAFGCGIETQAPKASARPIPVNNFVFMTAILLIGCAALRFVPQRLHAGVEFHGCVVRLLPLRRRFGQLRIDVRLFRQLRRRLLVVVGCSL